MKILEIKNIVRKDFPIYYRRIYSSLAVIELLGKLIEINVDFQFEHKPSGSKDLTITSIGQVDYPLLPLKKELIKIIVELDARGQLPN